MHNTCNSLSTAKMNGLNTSERYGKGRLDQPKGIEHHMTMADMKIIAMTENTTHAIPILK